MTHEVSFFYPKMKDYLEEINLSFNAYIMHVYNGNILTDEYVIGALGKMFNIEISVISPYYTDIWNLYHDSGMADVILVSNVCHTF